MIGLLVTNFQWENDDDKTPINAHFQYKYKLDTYKINEINKID